MAQPYTTLRHSLVFSGLRDDTGGIETTNDGVFLNTTAIPYQGVDMNLTVGKSVSDSSAGPKNDAIQFGAGMTLTPHRAVAVNLRYDDRIATISEPFFPDREDRTLGKEAGVAFSPLPSLYFYASRRHEERTGRLDRTVDTFAFSWAPFPGGALQLSLSFNESHYSDLDEVERLIVPFLRWNINPRTYFDFAWQMITSERDYFRREDDIMTATLRLGF
jgi:hypothetical protein